MRLGDRESRPAGCSKKLVKEAAEANLGEVVVFGRGSLAGLKGVVWFGCPGGLSPPPLLRTI